MVTVSFELKRVYIKENEKVISETVHILYVKDSLHERALDRAI